MLCEPAYNFRTLLKTHSNVIALEYSRIFGEKERRELLYSLDVDDDDDAQF